MYNFTKKVIRRAIIYIGINVISYNFTLKIVLPQQLPWAPSVS